MTRVTDITGKLEPGMWDYRVFPGFDDMIPPFSVETIATVPEQGFFASRIVASTITGTYLEASAHVIEGGRTLDSYSVADFIKPVHVLRLGKLAPHALIDDAMLAAADTGVKPGDAVIVDTGWYLEWNKAGYVANCPKMLPSALAWLIDRQIGLLGVDVPAIEAAWSEDDDAAKGGLLTQLFADGCLLLAPVVALDQVGANTGRLITLPMPVVGTSGAPVRAVIEW